MDARRQHGGHAQAPAVGARAPEGHFTSATGEWVALSDVMQGRSQAIVMFYRGFY